MKKTIILTCLLVLLLLPQQCLAAKARNIATEKDSAYHAAHLEQHIGETTCHGTGNYLKVRQKIGSSKLNGRLEQADGFTLLDVKEGYVLVDVFYSDKTSPKSFVGLRGWVDADYIDCYCSEKVYRNQIQSYDEVLDMIFRSFIEEWDYEQYSDYGIGSDIIWLGNPRLLDKVGFMFEDLDCDGSKELIIGFLDDVDDYANELWLVYTMNNNKVQLALEGWARSSIYLRKDGTIFNTGSDGASDHTYQIYAFKDGRKQLLEGVRVWLDVKDDPEYNGYYHFAIMSNTETLSTEIPITEEEGQRRIKYYSQTIQPDFTPLSEWK